MNDPNDFVAAYFDKSGSDDNALTFGSLKWQRRFFIFSDSQRMLYYFKSPDDVPKVWIVWIYEGRIHLLDPQHMALSCAIPRF